MTPNQAWHMIITKIGYGPREFQTTPLSNKPPVWFTAQKDDDQIRITKALGNKPSSKISTPRFLYFKTFEKVYPIYLRRKQGEKVSKEVTKITVNSVYYYSLIKFLTDL